jgi:hypothetical protein
MAHCPLAGFNKPLIIFGHERPSGVAGPISLTNGPDEPAAPWSGPFLLEDTMALACGGDDDHLMPKVPEERSRKSFYPQFEVEGACDRKAAVTFNRRSIDVRNHPRHKKTPKCFYALGAGVVAST